MHPEFLFEGEEFAWTDSAYAVTPRTIPIHKQPASLDPANAIFDRVLATLRVQSEHCMGALKGWFQCLQGLRVDINSNLDHAKALQWITTAIILHNLIIDVEGAASTTQFMADHGHAEELEDCGGQDAPQGADEEAGETKHQRLVEELIAYRSN